ncbi:hypothetical protein [Crassaminicella profunda]|uniref:hypothetical protein n=1 Tax=Crassaminicella profunda TaxID=1286698 RepID=UPI001CA6B353|nr:hypothetical protein [Crassaminicella profunda]QZY56520.1 hypothetical protein K7H06_06240 [Crassaminicella profunda]
MIKKIFALLLIILLLFAAFILNEFFNNNQYISTFKTYVVPNLKISNTLLEDYYSTNSNLHKKASESIILTTLKNLNYDQWIEYIDYIDLILYKSNVLPAHEDELIVVLNLSKDTSVIAIYSSINDEYVFTNKIENILPVQNIKFIPVSELGYNLLITDQLLDERLGAFFLEEFIEIFLYTDDNFKSVFKKTKYKDEIYNAKWINPKASPNEWIKIIENNHITFNQKPKLNIQVSISRQKFKTMKKTFPSKEDFKLIEEIITQENYYWNPKYQMFVINEGMIKNSSTSVAIIDDTNHWTESFLGFPSNNYKIITKNGKIFYLHKQFISIKQ